MTNGPSNFYCVLGWFRRVGTSMGKVFQRVSQPSSQFHVAQICGSSGLILMYLISQSLTAQGTGSAIVRKDGLRRGQPVATAPSHALIGPTDTTLATLKGLVNDSLHLIPLSDALIRVTPRDVRMNGIQRSARTASTDASGLFRIDGLVPGVYDVEVKHPLLDSLGLHLIAQSVQLHDGVVSSVLLQIPSATGLVKKYCGDAPSLEANSGMLVGRVMDADADTGLAGARVQLIWHTIEINTAGAPSIRSVPRRAEVTSGYRGVYEICNVPAGLSGHILTTYRDNPTASVPVAFGGEAVAIYQLSVDVRNAALSPQRDSATNSGSSLPPSANRSDVARRTMLAPIEIHALRRRSAFEYRQHTGQGHYVDSAAIQNRHAMDFAQLIETIPRLTLGGTPGLATGSSTINANTCPLSARLVVDGVVMHADNVAEVNANLSVADIAAIEVYDIATAPAVFAALMGSCGNIVVVWTKGFGSH